MPPQKSPKENVYLEGACNIVYVNISFEMREGGFFIEEEKKMAGRLAGSSDGADYDSDGGICGGG